MGQLLRRYGRSLNHVGVAMALLFFSWSLTPSLLPRAWQVQGLVSGVTLACGYAIGVTIAWSARRLGVPEPSKRVRRWAWCANWVMAALTIPVILWLSSGWQREIRLAVQLPPGQRRAFLGVFVIAALTAAGLIGVVRIFHDLYLVLTRRLRRFLPRVAARLASAVVVVALAVGLFTGVLPSTVIYLADTTFSAADHGNYDGVVQPITSLRSGSHASLVPWDTLGMEGRSFVAAGPTPTTIAQFSGHPATMPIRIFVGRLSAHSLQGEAELVLAELKRTDAFERQLLAVAVATGTGWIDPALADPLEYMYGGDSAIASMQYSFLPSWLSFLDDREHAQQAGRLLFNTIYDYWTTLSPARRPRLVIFGESLGAYGAASAFSSVADMTARTNGALLVGTPDDTAMWRQLTDHRTPTSSERLPVVGDGRTVRFAATAGDLRQPDGSLDDPKVIFLQHASDPVVWWSPTLIWHKPGWIDDDGGADVTHSMHWYPLVTFWQVTCDLLVSTKVPPGHGHNYGREAATAWAAILHPPGWRESDTNNLALRTS